MAWSYRKRIKIIPGIHLNISKNGVSTSIGVKGSSLNFSSSGTRLNTNILGFSNSNKISGSTKQITPSNFNPNLEYSYSELSDNIFSSDLHEITSQNMAGIKESILISQKQKSELYNDLKKIKRALGFSKTKKIASYVFVYGIFNKRISSKLNIDINSQKEAIRETKIVINNSTVNIDIHFDEHTKIMYERFYNSFKNLCNSHQIWDITGSHFQNRVATRSSASTIVNRKKTRIGLRSLPIIKSNYQALYFQNVNGADLYFYPTFIVMYHSNQRFALIGMNEINFEFSSVDFTETSTIPRDSKIVRKTWAKVNKNGTPDKRFKNNYQIPVVKYGRLRFSSSTGLNEEYQISNYEFSEIFFREFKEYKNVCNELEF